LVSSAAFRFEVPEMVSRQILQELQIGGTGENLSGWYKAA
jgi:hypothetical protein